MFSSFCFESERLFLTFVVFPTNIYDHIEGRLIKIIFCCSYKAI